MAHHPHLPLTPFQAQMLHHGMQQQQNMHMGMMSCPPAQQPLMSCPPAQQPLQQQLQQCFRIPPVTSNLSSQSQPAADSAETGISYAKITGVVKAKGTKRVTQNETIMSKIATTLLSNMTTFGVKAMRKGGHGRKGSIAQLVALLDDDAAASSLPAGDVSLDLPGEATRELPCELLLPRKLLLSLD